MRLKLNHLRRRNQAGATLIEAIVSMGVFGISFVSLYAGMSMSFSIIGNARENLRATQVMVEKMETIRLYSWDQINTSGFIPATFTEYYDPSSTGGGATTATSTGGGGTGGNVTYQQTASAPVGDNGGTTGNTGGVAYSGRVTIANGPSGHTYSADMKRVTISVNWTSAGGRTHSRSMNTYVTRNGLQNYIY